MKVGMVLPEAGQQATRENIVQAAKLAEEERFDSLWVWERLLCPINPQTPYPNTPDGSFPIEFQNVLDTLQTLTFVAANTNRIALGTSVIDMLFHNPVILARRFATLDILSEGRAVCGLGIGWSKDEYQASNIPLNDRGNRANEYIQLIKRIWTDDIVEFKGKYYSIPASKIGPKPFQKPHPPIYMGASTPRAFRRMVKYTNGCEFKLILLTYPKVVEQRKQDPCKKEGQRPPMTGTIDEIGSDLKKIKDMGVGHVIFGYSFGPIGRDVDEMIDLTKQLSKFC
jgi:probable F420-dependent oxidoreductase